MKFRPSFTLDINDSIRYTDARGMEKGTGYFSNGPSSEIDSKYAGGELRDALGIAGIAVGLVILIGIIRLFFRKKNINKFFQSVSCFNCGWRGQVSRYAGRCPQCNQPLGEQKARRRP
jgi:ssDNA-binding Zn-finger/Zn-ribbon topoisomerase 1